MANKGPFLASGDSLDDSANSHGDDDYLVSPNGLFFAVMQSNGIFCVYRGSGPMNKAPLPYVWGTQKTAPGGTWFYARMQETGEFCVFHGSGGGNQRLIWGSEKTMPGGQFFLAMQDDGNLCVYLGTPSRPFDYVWGIGAAPARLLAHAAKVRNSVLHCVIKATPCWNNLDDLPNGRINQSGHGRDIVFGHHETLDLAPYYQEGRLREGATCWIKVDVVDVVSHGAHFSGSSNGNFTFTGSGANAFYDATGESNGISLKFDINGPFGAATWGD